MAKNKNKGGVVYSTNPNYNYNEESGQETPEPNDQILHLHFEKKGRGGKPVCVVRNFVGDQEDLKDLGKTLKQKLAVGGSAKNGEIVLQGAQREKVQEILENLGYRTKRIGG